LALLVAESKPSDKDAMVKLIVNLINKKWNLHSAYIQRYNQRDVSVRILLYPWS
jgi:hypothetical protein